MGCLGNHQGMCSLRLCIHRLFSGVGTVGGNSLYHYPDLIPNKSSNPFQNCRGPLRMEIPQYRQGPISKTTKEEVLMARINSIRT